MSRKDDGRKEFELVKLLLVRHAHAEDRDAYRSTGNPDDMRPLTQAGIQEMEQIAKSICCLFPNVDQFASSPLVRAQQTLNILTHWYDCSVERNLNALEPTAHPKDLLNWLASVKENSMRDFVCVVGHEPHLSVSASYLVKSSVDSFFKLKKGGLCLLSFKGKMESGKANLRCLLQPRQLLSFFNSVPHPSTSLQTPRISENGHKEIE